MIKRENLKQAIDAISKRNPEIGYSLDTMLGAGEIALPARSDPAEDSGLCFVFKGQNVQIRRYLYFQEGTVPLEQQLQIKHGELAKKQELQDSSVTLDYRRAAAEIHTAGLSLMLDYEIDIAAARVRRDLQNLQAPDSPAAGLKTEQPDRFAPACRHRSRIQVLTDLLSSLEFLQRDDRTLAAFLSQDAGSEYQGVRFDGVVGYVTSAPISRFPFAAMPCSRLPP